MRPFHNFGKMAADKKHFKPKTSLFKPAFCIDSSFQRDLWERGISEQITWFFKPASDLSSALKPTLSYISCSVQVFLKPQVKANKKSLQLSNYKDFRKYIIYKITC